MNEPFVFVVNVSSDIKNLVKKITMDCMKELESAERSFVFILEVLMNSENESHKYQSSDVIYTP